MTSNFGINTNTSLFNSLFGSTSTTGSTTGGSSVLGDYALIRSGAYKKLLKAYYDEDRTTQNTGSSEETSEEKAEKAALMSVKTAASDLRSAASALKESEGSGTDRLEEAKSFVTAYNSFLDSMDELDNTKILQKTLWLIADFEANSGLLEDAGITIGSDNKLTLNEEKFKAAGENVLATLFNESYSLMDKVAGKTFDVINRATEAVTKLKGGSTYTDKGEYTKLNTSTLYDELF